MNLFKIVNGYKTYLAGAGMILLGVVDIINGEWAEGGKKITEGVALIGIGHKLEKAAA